MATISDIARITGLSVATVSRYINGHPHVSAEAASEIKRVVSELGYVPTKAAVSLRRGSSGQIAVILPTTAHSFYAALLAAISNGAGSRSYDVLLRQAEGRPTKTAARLRSLIRTRAVDGVIVAGDTLEDVLSERGEFGIPVIACDQVVMQQDCSAVYIDHRQSTLDVLSHLSQRGYRSIAVVVSSAEYSTTRSRKAAVEAFLRGAPAGAPLPSVSFVTEDDDDSLQAGRELGERLFEMQPRPDAIFTGADQLSAGVLTAARNRGIAVPGELAIVGFDDQTLSQALGITSVYQPVEQIGAKAVELLYSESLAIRRGERPQRQEICLPHELRIRETT